MTDTDTSWMKRGAEAWVSCTPFPEKIVIQDTATPWFVTYRNNGCELVHHAHVASVWQTELLACIATVPIAQGEIESKRLDVKVAEKNLSKVESRIAALEAAGEKA